MDSEKHIALLTKKIAREKAIRLQAETLLEQKSRELFNAKRIVEDQLSSVQKKAELDITLLKFKSLLDSILLEYNQKLLAKNISPLIIQQLLDDLSSLPELQSCALNFSNFKLFSGLAFTLPDVEALGEVTWDEGLFKWSSNKTQLRVKIIIDQKQSGLVSFNFEQQPIDTWLHQIEQHCCLFSEMLSAAYTREQLLANTLAEKKRAEHSEKATRDFVAMINHELRTPLNGLLGSAELMNDTQINQYQQKLLTTINQSGEMLRVIINDLLDISKMSAGMLQLNKAPFNSKQVMAIIRDIFQIRAEEKKLSFTFQGIEQLPTAFIGDAERIKQIFVNLIGNALKFTEQGEIKVTVIWSNDLFSFNVIDTGFGIPAENISSLFEPFTQADNSSNRKFEGTGLGLSICKSLIDTMNGKITVHSEVNKGTEFSVQIPLLVSESIAQDKNQPKNTLSFDITDLKVLVVEDIKVNQTIIKMMLKKFGVVPAIAENGLLALEYIANNAIDMIFMDCRMPVMDGFEATRKLREQGYEKPIVALTAGTNSMEREECIASGMNAVVHKPYQLIEIKGALECWGVKGLQIRS